MRGSIQLSLRSKSALISFAAATTAAALFASNASAVTQTSTWAGANGSNWNNAANWTPAGVPNNGTNSISDYNVVIGGSANLDIAATIDGLTINSGSQLVINPAQVLTLNGPTLVNNGLLQVDNFSSNGALNFAANTTISGTGNIYLFDYNPNARITAAAGVTITQAAGHTIRGVGEIDAALVNNGTVNANYASPHALILQTNAMTNNSLFEATVGGILDINGITLTQGASAQIYVDAASGSSVHIDNGATINGGALNAAAGGVYSVDNATFKAVTVGAGANVQVNSGHTLNISGGSLTNNGLIAVDDFGSNATLNFTVNTNLTGSGSIFIRDYNPNAILTSAAGAVVTQAATHTIYGVGEIDAALVNNGVVNANQSRGSRTLVLQSQPMTNNNLIEATNTGIINVNGITLTQGSAGQLFADVGSAISINNGATIVGGTIKAAVGGVVNVNELIPAGGSNSSTFNNVTVAAGTNVYVTLATILNIAGGALANNGLITVDQHSSNASINFTASTALSGSGTIFLNDWSPYAKLTGNAGVTVTQAAAHTIDGIGEIDVALVNNGVVNANDTRGTHAIALAVNPKTNNNLLEATGGGILEINGITVTQSSAGHITAATGSGITLANGATVAGGTLDGPGGVTINGGTVGGTPSANATLNGVTIGTGTPFAVPPNASLTLVNTVNNGALTIGGSATLTNLTGSGTLTINDNTPGVVTLPLNSGRSSQSGLSITYGKLDLTNNSFAINYAGSASPAATIRGYLLSGRNGGAWTGSGIVSSKAAANPGYAIGYADGIDGASSNQILLKYTLAGDTNLSGNVDFSDLLALAKSYNTTSGAVWTSGDVNYDGAVNFDDLLALAKNYGQSAVLTAADAAALNAVGGSLFASDFALAQSLIPEPTTLATAAAIVMLAGRRRVRHRNPSCAD